MSKAKVLFIDGQSTGYYLTDFCETENGFSGFVENGLFDIKLDGDILYCFYDNGEISYQFQLNSYELVDLDILADDDYNSIINRAWVKLNG